MATKFLSCLPNFYPSWIWKKIRKQNVKAPGLHCKAASAYCTLPHSAGKHSPATKLGNSRSIMNLSKGPICATSFSDICSAVASLAPLLYFIPWIHYSCNLEHQVEVQSCRISHEISHQIDAAGFSHALMVASHDNKHVRILRQENVNFAWAQQSLTEAMECKPCINHIIAFCTYLPALLPKGSFSIWQDKLAQKSQKKVCDCPLHV